VRVHFCGVRGSTPAPGAEFVRYGGNTSCVALAHGDDDPTLLLDVGTGALRVPPLLCGRPFEGTILITHLHWDHTHGLPFFSAADRDDATTTVLLPAQEDGTAADDVLARVMSPPHFPVGPYGLRGAWTYGSLLPGTIMVMGFEVTALEVPHKGGRTYGYRVREGDATITYIPDHCPTVLGDGPDGLGPYHDAALELARDTDVLIHDATLLPDEVPAEAFFGHAAADYAVGLGAAAGAASVVLFHHKPSRTDDELDELAARLEPRGATVATESLVLTL
jgi:phosphoribosyl 1,2-cyclic phosphodiesterase